MSLECTSSTWERGRRVLCCYPTTQSRKAPRADQVTATWEERSASQCSSWGGGEHHSLSSVCTGHRIGKEGKTTTHLIQEKMHEWHNPPWGIKKYHLTSTSGGAGRMENQWAEISVSKSVGITAAIRNSHGLHKEHRGQRMPASPQTGTASHAEQRCQWSLDATMEFLLHNSICNLKDLVSNPF